MDLEDTKRMEIEIVYGFRHWQSAGVQCDTSSLPRYFKHSEMWILIKRPCMWYSSIQLLLINWNDIKRCSSVRVSVDIKIVLLLNGFNCAFVLENAFEQLSGTVLRIFYLIYFLYFCFVLWQQLMFMQIMFILCAKYVILLCLICSKIEYLLEYVKYSLIV